MIHPTCPAGEVANRKAWHNTDKLTPEVLELYKAPLRVEGWDSALVETTRVRSTCTPGDIAGYLGSVRGLPALVVTGARGVWGTGGRGAGCAGRGREEAVVAPPLGCTYWAELAEVLPCRFPTCRYLVLRLPAGVNECSAPATATNTYMLLKCCRLKPRPLPSQSAAAAIAGEHDRIVPPSKAESLCSDLPRGRLTVLSDCGHLSHEEVPGALLSQLVPFCGSVLLHLGRLGQ